jgi:LAS superfamily LD-carboxypeptidase LdcB
MSSCSRRRGGASARRRRVLHAPTIAITLAVAILAGGPLLRLGLGAGRSDVALAVGPLPACRYDDVLTSPRGYGQWQITLVDTILEVPKAYVPPDLVSVSAAGIEGAGKVRAVMIDDLRAMADAARQAGAGIAVKSAYRSYAQQQATFRYWVDQLGRAQAKRVSARPGHSEHQLGLAIDFKSDSGGSPFEGDWGQTPAGQWMAANAWTYGFVMSYPKGGLKVTCYEYEPWHFRYLGRDLAQLVHDSGLTIREYLWANFTESIVPPPSGEPLPTSAPTATPDATLTASPSVEPTAQPSPSPSQTSAPTAAPSPTPSISPTPVAEPSEPPMPNVLLAGLGIIDQLGHKATAALIVGFTLLAGALLTLWRRGRLGAVP